LQGRPQTPTRQETALGGSVPQTPTPTPAHTLDDAFWDAQSSSTLQHSTVSSLQSRRSSCHPDK
jgi:hypothetical protein